jgi:putative addiction module component (TIGR02574 family)
LSAKDHILEEALLLSPFEKAQLIDKLISSLDKPDNEVNDLWANEAEDRIDAHDNDKLKKVSLETVLAKYK